MTFMLPLKLIDPEEPRSTGRSTNPRERPAYLSSASLAREMLALAREAGFNQTQHASTADFTQRYFTGRTDGLWPSSGEAFLVATT
jgi:hypothetical protein